MSKIELKQLSFAYDNQEVLLFDQANITMDTNWKLGLIGRNGRGKTTLLRLYKSSWINKERFFIKSISSIFHKQLQKNNSSLIMSYKR